MLAMLEAVSGIQCGAHMDVEIIDIYSDWSTVEILPDFSRPQIA